jgi:signal transduction histidine kinase
MESISDRRTGWGRRRSDLQSVVALRGLLHDLGHDLLTLSCLADAMLDDPSLSEQGHTRANLIVQETSRMLDNVRQWVRAGPKPHLVAVRPLLSQIASLAELAHGTSVTLLPGPPVALNTDGSMLWRLVGNLVANAARAAGPQGQVELSVTQTPEVVIEVIDDGPGFGYGPSGWASLGLTTVSGLAQACGGQVDIYRRTPTRVRVSFPESGVKTDGGQC